MIPVREAEAGQRSQGAEVCQAAHMGAVCGAQAQTGQACVCVCGGSARGGGGGAGSSTGTGVTDAQPCCACPCNLAATLSLSAIHCVGPPQQTQTPSELPPLPR